jgi:hypothetical protein
MHGNPKNILVLMIVLAIALLPFRFGHAAGVDGDMASGESLSSHLDTHGCDHVGSTHTSHSCDDYSAEGSSLDDCCGDHCSSAQIFLPSAFNLHFTPSHGFDLAWSLWLPEPLASAEHRPPIKLH